MLTVATKQGLRDPEPKTLLEQVAELLLIYKTRQREQETEVRQRGELEREDLQARLRRQAARAVKLPMELNPIRRQRVRK